MKKKHLLSVTVVCLLILTFFSYRVPAEEKEAGLVLHYDFDEGSGTVARDKSGNGLDGRILQAKYVVHPAGGFALELDGATSCVQIPQNEAFNRLGKPGQSYSIEFWFRTRGGVDQALTEKWPVSSVSYPWAIRGPYPDDNSIRFAIYDAATGKSNFVAGSKPVCNDGRWHHLAAVRNMPQSRLCIYLDGVLAGECYDGQTDADMSNDGAILVGARHYTTYAVYGFKGRLDDFRIYVKPLSAEEVKAHYEAMAKHMEQSDAAEVKAEEETRARAEAEASKLPVHRETEDFQNVYEFLPVKPHLSLRKNTLLVQVGSRAEMQIDTGQDSYRIESCFSYPGPEQKIGWNGLPEKFNQPRYPDVESQLGQELSWKPVVTQVDRDIFTVTVKGECYQLERTVKILEGRLDVEDKLTSLLNTPTGIVVRHGITASEDFVERFSPGLEVPANPTVFLKGPRRSVALVMNDPVARLRFRPALGASENHSGVQINRFVLNAGKSYTFRWSVYVMDEEQGYFNFINRVRRDWNANFTIQGPFCFGALKPEGDDIRFYFVHGNEQFLLNKVLNDPVEFKEYLKWKGVRIVGIMPWLDYDPGAIDHVLTRQEYKQLMQKFLVVMRKAAPDVHVVGCIETDWLVIRRDKVKDGDKLPVPQQPASIILSDELTPEQIRVVEEGLPEWKDSFVRTQNGKLEMEQYFRAGKPIDPDVRVYPKVGNRHYRFIMDQILFLLNEVGMDGVYMDEFPMAQIGAVRNYGSFDGLSADISFGTGEIYDSYTDCSLSGIEARVQFINKVLSMDKIFIANRYSTTSQEQPLPALRFTETGSVLANMDWPAGTKPPAINYLLFASLNSPIGFGLASGPSSEDRARWLMRGLITYLRHGMLLYYGDSGPAEPPKTEAGRGALLCVREMFPITPVELGEGFIVGKERIISTISLNRPWKKEAEPTVLLFDISGKQIDETGRYEMVSEAGQKKIKLNLKNWSEIAIVK